MANSVQKNISDPIRFMKAAPLDKKSGRRCNDDDAARHIDTT